MHQHYTRINHGCQVHSLNIICFSQLVLLRMMAMRHEMEVLLVLYQAHFLKKFPPTHDEGLMEETYKRLKPIIAKVHGLFMDLYGMLVDGENKKKVQELLYIQHFRECMSDLLKSIKISLVMIF